MTGVVNSLRDWGTYLYYGAATAGPLAWVRMTQGAEAFAVKPRERPSVLDDVDLGSHHLVQLKDVKLHYVSKGDTSKPLMLFLHGYPEFWYSWRHQIKEFAKDYWVVAIDMRGYSESDKPEGIRHYRMEHLVEDVRQFIHIQGRQKAILVAHDWGGIIAFSVASKHPELVEKLIICNSTHPKVWRDMIHTSAEQRQKSWYTFLFQWPMLPEMMTRLGDLNLLKMMLVGKQTGCKRGRITNEDIEAFKYTFKDYEGIQCPLNYYRALAAHQPDESYYRRSTVPTLILWGNKDLYIGAGVVKATQRYCDDCVVKPIEGACHWVQQDEPELVNKHIRDYLQNKNMTSSKL